MNVLEQIQAFALTRGPFNEEEAKKDIHKLQANGLNDCEVLAYMKCMEEYNPYISEEVALKQMNTIIEQMGDRYKGKKSYSDIEISGYVFRVYSKSFRIIEPVYCQTISLNRPVEREDLEAIASIFKEGRLFTEQRFRKSLEELFDG